MRRTLLIAALALAVAAPNGASGERAAPAPQRPADDPALSHAGLNQNIRIGRLTIRPVRVTEDSRCPANVVCVWAGRLVLRLRVSGMRGEQTVSTMEPLRLPGGGALELVRVWPQRYHGAQAREPYRFGFRRR